MNLAEVYVQIMGDDRPLHRTLAGVHRTLLGLGGVGATAGSGLFVGVARGAAPLVGAMGTLGVAAGAALSKGVLIGTAGIGYGLFKAVTGAAHLNEALNATGAVFGKSADLVIAKADEMDRAFGVSKRQSLDATAQFGAIAQGMGMAQDKAAKFSAEMLQLAVDAKSFKDSDIPTALEKIRAGLTGESEPLKAWGVIMSEDATKAEAYAMGITKAGAELTNLAKLTARASIISKSLGAAQGDMARTSGGASNQFDQLGGRIENLGDAIGHDLTPAWADLLHAINATVLGMTTSLKSGEGAASTFVTNVKGGLETAGAVYRNFSDVVSLVGVNAAEMWTNFVETLQWVGETAGVVANYLFNHFGDAITAIQTAFVNLGSTVGSALQEIYDYLASGFKDPIEIRVVPILEGFKGAELKLPELKLSNFDDKRQKFIDNMNKTEQGNATRKAEEAKKLAEAAAPDAITPGAEKGDKAEKEKKATHQDLAGFAKSLQEGIFGKDHGKRGADAQVRTAKATEALLKKASIGGMAGIAVAAGPA